MDEMNNDKRIVRKQNYFWVITVLLVIILAVVGGTYAYFAFSATNNSVDGNGGEVDLSLTVTKILPDRAGTDDIIITGFTNLADELNDGCLYTDGEYATCQLYQITLTNNSTTVNTDVSGSVKFDNETTPNLSWILVDNYSSATTYTSDDLGSTYNTSSSGFVKFEEEYLISTGETINYYMLVWINDSADNQTDNGGYSGTIRFEDVNGNGVTSTFAD